MKSSKKGPSKSVSVQNFQAYFENLFLRYFTEKIQGYLAMFPRNIVGYLVGDYVKPFSGLPLRLSDVHWKTSSSDSLVDFMNPST